MAQPANKGWHGIAALTLLLLLTGSLRGQEPATQPAWSVEADHWYVFTLTGSPVGWMRIVRERSAEHIRTVQEMSMAVHRGGAELNVNHFVQWLETHDGAPVRLEYATRQSEKLKDANGQPMSAWERTREGDREGLLVLKRAWEFTDKNVTKIVPSEQQEVRVTMPRPSGPWVPPAAMQRSLMNQIQRGVQQIAHQSLNAGEELQFIDVSSTRIGSSQFPWDSKILPTTAWQTQAAGKTPSTITHYREDGALVYSISNVAMGVLETKMCARDLALAQTVPGIRNLRERRSVPCDQEVVADDQVVLEIALEEVGVPPIPATDNQSAELLDQGRRLRITRQLQKPNSATAAEMAESKLRDELESLVANDPLSRNLAAAAMRKTTALEPQALARSACKVVAEYASQQSNQTPAKLLAEVLGVHRIQARIVSGLAKPTQAERSLEWRIWTQALIDGIWVDLDPSECDSAGFRVITGISGPGTAFPDPDPSRFVDRLEHASIRVVSQR